MNEMQEHQLSYGHEKNDEMLWDFTFDGTGKEWLARSWPRLMSRQRFVSFSLMLKLYQRNVV